MIETLLSTVWLNRLKRCNQLYVGLSGGLDSIALLHTLSQNPTLHSRLIAIHVNHSISPNADSWQIFCQQFSKTLNIPFKAFKPDFPKHANIEEEARIARYGIFRSLITKQDGLILAHHKDDQAETLLLNLFRGAGIDGLAAMPAEKPCGQGILFRPLLQWSRKQLESYVRHYGLNWVDDESNCDPRYSRNFLRHEIMPSILERWPDAISRLNQTAEHCQEAKLSLAELGDIDAGDVALDKTSLELNQIKKLSRSRLSNLLRLWLQNNNVRLPSAKRFKALIDELIFAHPQANPRLSWDEIIIRRYQNKIYITENRQLSKLHTVFWKKFPEPLEIAGVGNIEAIPAKNGFCLPKKAVIDVRFRLGGEKFQWHGQTKSLKILLQEWQIPPWQRERIPLIYINNELAAVGDLAVSDLFWCSEDAWAISFSQFASLRWLSP